MIFRTQDEIRRKLNRMEAPTAQFCFVEVSEDSKINMQNAFESGYKQAIKEMKEYFNIKGNGTHTRYEE